jgi:hypothetical protein
MHLRRTLFVPALLATLAAARPAKAEGPRFLPDFSVDLMAARYAPAETDLDWTSRIGAGASLLRVKDTTAFGSAGVETILGSGLRPFEATQANYHLELGIAHRRGSVGIAVFFHHVSRHLVDRPKVQAVDWNVLGVRVSRRFPRALGVPARVEVGVGHTTLASYVGYRWELTFRLEADLLRRGWGGAYLASDTRFVTAEASPELPRNDFVDQAVEAGVRVGRAAGAFDAFVAYEHRNDVFVLEPGVRDRALFGIRFRLPGGRPAGEEPPVTPPSSASSGSR